MRAVKNPVARVLAVVATTLAGAGITLAVASHNAWAPVSTSQSRPVAELSSSVTSTGTTPSSAPPAVEIPAATQPSARASLSNKAFAESDQPSRSPAAGASFSIPQSDPTTSQSGSTAGSDSLSETPQSSTLETSNIGRTALPLDDTATNFSETDQNTLATAIQSSALTSLNSPGGKAAATVELPRATFGESYCVSLQHAAQIQALSAQPLRGTFPKGLLLDRPSTKLCGTPTEKGIFRFEVDFRDPAGSSFQSAFRLVIADKQQSVEPAALKIATTQLAVGQVGAEYLFQLIARGGKPPYRWSIDGLPSGVELDPESGIIAGKPEVAAAQVEAPSTGVAGEHQLEISLSDAAGKKDSKRLTLLVRTTPIFVTTNTLTAGVIGEHYQLRLAAQGGTPPYRWQLAAGELPAGLQLGTETGLIEGVPSATFAGKLRIKAVDSAGGADTAELPFEVGASSLAITTSALAEGFLGERYAFQLTASGGVAPYSWKVNGSGLPSGLSVAPSGEISGTPNKAGESGFTISVSDAASNAASRRFRVRVQSLPEEQEESASGGDSSPQAGGSTGGGVNTGGASASDPDSKNPFPGVTQLSLTPSNRKVGLSWRVPSGATPLRAIVVRNETQIPTTVADGVTIYAGAEQNTFLDLGLAEQSSSNGGGLVNGTTYYYRVFLDYGVDSTGAPIIGEVTDASGGEVVPTNVSLNGSVSPGASARQAAPFADRVAQFSPLDPKCFGCNRSSTVVLGPPAGAGDGNGSTDVVSLGARVNNDGGVTAPYGGTITLEFTDNLIVNGPGVDFVVFENAFRLAGTDEFFVEPAVVDVSADGIKFYRFPFDYVARLNNDGSLNLFNPHAYHYGFAGVHAVYSNGNTPPATDTVLAGGDQFDLSDLPGAPLSWARFVRLTATGDSWFIDQQGEPVRHSNSDPTWAASGAGKSGFDLDGAVALHD